MNADPFVVGGVLGVGGGSGSHINRTTLTQPLAFVLRFTVFQLNPRKQTNPGMGAEFTLRT